VLTAFRIGDPEGAFPIFDANGSKLFPGRWNTAEAPIIYASEHYSTAMLEKLAGSNGELPPNQHYIDITIPNGLSYEMLDPARLPDWDHPDPKTRAALHYARTLTLDDGRDAEVYAELKQHFTWSEVIELSAFFCLTAGGNRMAKSWGIEPHGEISSIPTGALSIHG